MLVNQKMLLVPVLLLAGDIYREKDLLLRIANNPVILYTVTCIIILLITSMAAESSILKGS